VETGIYVRLKVDDRWGSYDIGNIRVSDDQVWDWMNGKDRLFVQNIVMTLLGRDQRKSFVREHLLANGKTVSAEMLR
jgi:hypothetical protein